MPFSTVLGVLIHNLEMVGDINSGRNKTTQIGIKTGACWKAPVSLP
jgi:hypothetical protein